VASGKTDRSDAEALLEAARSASLAPVPIKSLVQQALLPGAPACSPPTAPAHSPQS
jgi:hypothetical protein